MAGETIVLDPTALGSGRTPLDITSYVAATGTAIDWGDAEMQAYSATLTIGEVRTHYRLPNRLIKIPLMLRTLGATSFSAIRASLEAKVGMIQRQTGAIMRQVGATPLYSDIQTATLHLGGSWLQAYRDVDVDAVLALECLPEWYGDELTLDSASVTGYHAAVLKLSAVTAAVAGNHPARCRIIVTDTSGHSQDSVIWGVRSRYYDSATTAALSYEAEALTLIGASSSVSFGSAYGTHIVNTGGAGAPANTWTTVISTTLATGSAQLTHQGTYRVWARVYLNNPVGAQIRFMWATGSGSVPTINDPVALPIANQYFLVDLGTISIQAPPVGSNAWIGAFQVYSPTVSWTVSFDKVFFQPLDEAAGKLIYTNTPPGALSQAGPALPTAAVSASGSLQAWTSPTSVEAADGAGASVQIASPTTGSNALQATAYGFAIPSGTVISGIQVQMAVTGAATFSPAIDNSVRLLKAGTLAGSDYATFLPVPVSSGAIGALPTWQTRTYGGPTDLWGTTWTATDINNTNFGVALVAFRQGLLATGSMIVDYITITVYYQYTGFALPVDAVVYANQPTELRTEGMYRPSPSGSFYSSVAQIIGDLPRLPPSGLEAKPVELFVKPSQGNLGVGPDAAIDTCTVQVKYRPCYLFTP